MARKDLTDVTVVMDRSYSMRTCQADAEQGLNEFVDQQKKDPGETLFSLVQFDHEYEFVHRGLPIQNVPALKLEPRGNTALLDAVGRAIVETGSRLEKIPESDRPGLVVFVILTDGEENSSREFTNARIKEMIKEQQEKYSWQFTFLGANQDAFAVGGAMGIPAAACGNYAESKTSGGLRAAASNVSRMKSARAGGQSVNCFYSDEERAEMQDDAVKTGSSGN